MLDSIMDNTNAASLRAEEAFFRKNHDVFQGYLARSNKKVSWNPSTPFLSSRPDGFLYSRADKMEAVIELKLVKKGEVLAKHNGVVYNVEQNIYELKPGHRWYTQIYVEMITSGLQRAILAVTEGEDEWIFISIKLEDSKARVIINNLWISFQITMQEEDNETIELKGSLIKRKPGRPKKNKCGAKKNFVVGRDHINLTRTVNSTIDNSDEAESISIELNKFKDDTEAALFS